MEVEHCNSGSKTRQRERSPGPRMRAWTTESTARKVDQRIPDVELVSSPSIEEVSSSEAPAVDAPAGELMPNGGSPRNVEERATTELDDELPSFSEGEEAALPEAAAGREQPERGGGVHQY